MKISHKLILGFWFLTACVWVVGYFSMATSRKELEKIIIAHDVLLAKELLQKVNQKIYSRIETFQEYTRDILLQNGIKQSNSAFEKLADIQGHIDTIDRQWRGQGEGVENLVFSDLMRSEVSEELQEKIEYYHEKYGYPVFHEVFATNKYGAIAGLTNKTTDFRQDDEEWWQLAKEKGLYVGDIAFDASSDTFTIDICVPIKDEEGNFFGVLKACLNIDEIIHLLKNAEKNETFSVQGYYLFTRDGKVIYSFDQEVERLQDVSQEELFQNISGEQGHFFAPGYGHHSDSEKLHVFVRSQGVREFSGFGWILLISHDAEEAFAPVDNLKRNLMLVSVLVTIFAFLISLLVFRIISLPLTNLRNAVEKLSKGEMGDQVDIHSTDEIGKVAAAFNALSSELKETTVSRDSLVKEVQERMRVEKALKVSEKKLSSVLNSVLTGILIIDAGSKEVVYANPAALDILGGGNEDFVGKKCYDQMCPSGKKRCPILDLGQEVDTSERVLINANGEGVPVLKSVSSEIINGRRCLIESFVDISDQKKAEQERETLIRDLQKALEEIKTLSGIVPICASCKKIRDDKGYWNQVETYVESHSKAQFSHAMCPECSDKLYGGEEWYEASRDEIFPKEK